MVVKVTDRGQGEAEIGGRGLGVGPAPTGSERKGVGMKRKTWIALLGLAVAIVPLALWYYRMEREAAA